MTTTLETANESLRAAVTDRLSNTPPDDPKMRGYVSPPATKPRDIVASTEESQHVEWDRLADKPYIEHLLKQQRLREDQADDQTYAEWRPAFRGDSPLNDEVHPTSQAFFDLCDALKEMHRRKSSDYGCPSGTDPLANIRNGARFVGIPSWKGAMVRLSDKVTRLASYNATGRLENESLEDNLFDLASYSLLALLLHREEQQ